MVKTLRKAKSDFFLRIIEEARGNSKTIWNQLNYLKGDKRKDRSSIELMVNGKLTNNRAVVAEALNYYFVDSVVTISQCFSPKYTEVYPVNTVEQALTLRAVSELDIRRTTTSLKQSRAKGIFGMDVVMLKELSESLVNPITKIINLSVSQGMFPCAWKSSVIVPIFKSGHPHSANNYRPINILPVVSKVAEKLMAAQITNHLNNSSCALHPMQFGFRANYSTEMANCYFT